MKFKIDVSRNWSDDRVPAMLVLEAEGNSVSETGMTSKGALARFRRAVSQWLTNTKAGRDAWQASSHDFNYGDFREYDVANDDDFIRFLHANGLEAAGVQRHAAEDLGEHWDSTFEPEDGQ